RKSAPAMNDPGLPERIISPAKLARFSSASKCVDNSVSTCDDNTFAPLLGSSNVNIAMSSSGNESWMTDSLGMGRVSCDNCAALIIGKNEEWSYDYELLVALVRKLRKTEKTVKNGEKPSLNGPINRSKTVKNRSAEFVLDHNHRDIEV